MIMTDILLLERWADHEAHGVLGEIYHEGEHICHTIERPWLNNQSFVSCIPAGTYRLEPFTRTNGDEVYCLIGDGVVRSVHEADNGERYAVLIHKGNWMTDLAGCIAPGEALNYGPDSQGDKRMMVTRSTSATQQLFDYIKAHGINRIAIVWKSHAA